MNEIVNKFLLGGGKCMPEMHLRQPRFAYSKLIERKRKFKINLSKEIT